MGRAACMEKIMRNTDDSPSFGPAALEDRALEDAELNAVKGGSLSLPYEHIKFEYTQRKA
jgi:hypothetical protein